MTAPLLVLASTSAIRAQLLRAAGLAFTAQPPRVDEEALRAALAAEGASPRDMADALAEMKARKIAERMPEACVIGCRPGARVLRATSSPSPTIPMPPGASCAPFAARPTCCTRPSCSITMPNRSGGMSAEARLTMQRFSDAYLDDYLARNWESMRATPSAATRSRKRASGCSPRIDGDHFTILGLPLLPLLGYLLGTRGFIAA